MPDIDIADFDEALAADRDDSFHTAVENHLTQALADHQALLQRGLAPAEFAEAKKIETALTKAIDVTRFSRKLNLKK